MTLVTPTHVLALRPVAGGYRLAWARERFQDTFWPIPALFLTAGGPRVLRTFLRSGITKLAFGLLMATFAYSIAFLVLAGGRHHEPDSRGLIVAVMLVGASLLVFLAYVAATMRLLQVAWVIAYVARRTHAAIRAHLRPAAAYERVPGPDPAGAHPWRIALAGRRRAGGVLQGVDHHLLVRLARQHDCVLRLLVRIGEYVPAGAEVVAGYGSAPGVRQLVAGLSLGRTRSLYQDPAYGLRQLVDIAAQALSPAVNQPTTAVQVIDRLEDLLLRIGSGPLLTGYYADEAGQVRFIEPAISWDDWLDLAFTEITYFGTGSPQVLRRLLAAYDVLGQRLAPALARPVRERRQALLAESASHPAAAVVARPDPLGLG